VRKRASLYQKEINFQGRLLCPKLFFISHELYSFAALLVDLYEWRKKKCYLSIGLDLFFSSCFVCKYIHKDEKLGVDFNVFSRIFENLVKMLESFVNFFEAKKIIIIFKNIFIFVSLDKIFKNLRKSTSKSISQSSH
jgi:hypothetical protein